VQTAEHTLADLVDLERLQRMCDSFAAAGDIGLAVLDPGGAVLVSAGWQDICKDFHRVHAYTLKACRESDARLGRRLSHGLHGPEAPRHVAHQCANGLWDVAFPLVIAGEHLANLFTGQFLYDDDVVDVAAFRARARRLGFDEAAYLEALARVPVLAHERVAQTISFLADFVGLLGELGLSALRQAQEREALAESEERLKEAQSIARLGRWELDLVGDRLHWSDGIFELFEIDPSRFGASYEAFLDAIHPDDRDAVDRAYSASLEDRQPYEVSHRLLMKDGRVKWVHQTCRTDFDAHGRPLRSIGVVQDVTEQMQAEDVLRQSEQRYRSLFEDNHAVMLLIDPRSGAIVDANPAACAWYGWSRAEMLAMRIDQINTLSDSEVRAEMAAARAQRRRVFSFKHRRADGTIRDVEVYSGPLELQGEALLYSMIHDVTERTRAEESLQESEALHRTILQTTMDGFWLVDAEGRLLEVNEAYCRMSGYSAKELLVMAIRDLQTVETAAETAAHIERITAQGEDRFESRHRRKDGTVFDVEVSVQVLPGGGGRLMVFVRDITERKLAESYREMGRAVLQILSEPGDLQDSIQRVLAALKTKTGCDAVGMRLQDGEDFPYFAQEGFSEGFLATENTLLERDADGEVRRDAGGRVRLECTCGLVISGKTDPASPLCTPGGSFWSNDSFPLLDLPPDQDPRHSPRNQCMHHGYASMALVPIRSKDRIVGLIHLDDRRKGRFTLETIELLEDIAAHLGAALMRKQAEEALRESEEQHRNLFESMAQGVVYQDAEGRIVAANPSAERILGLSLDQMQGRTSMDPRWRAIHEDGSAFPGDRHPAMVSLRTGREVSDVVMGVFNPTSGSSRWMTVNAAPQFRPGEGKPYRVFATFDDITARKRAEEELREARDYLENLFGYANAPIVVWDAEQRVTRFNHAFEELTGRTAGEVVGKHLELLFPEDARRAGTLEHVTQASAGERWQVVEIPILREGGEVRTVLWNSATLYADDGTTPVATIAQGQDISERKRAEQALARLNEDLVDETAALAEANATITRIAATDHLTGLANRRHFHESLEKAVSLARRHGSPLALVALDLDGLKQVNDSAGHEAGDKALTSFADLLAALCRAEDLPGRLGGDEFSVLLPGIELGGARGLAERVLAAVRSSEALAARGVTVSAGVAQWTPGELPDDLLRRADEALYAAKRGGGDAVAGGDALEVDRADH